MMIFRLLDKEGKPVLDEDGKPITTTTDENGDYLFEDLPPGEYRVGFVLPSSMTCTGRTNVGDDTLDSDAIPGECITDTVLLLSGEHKIHVDAGIVNKDGSPIPLANTGQNVGLIIGIGLAGVLGGSLLVVLKRKKLSLHI